MPSLAITRVADSNSCRCWQQDRSYGAAERHDNSKDSKEADPYTSDMSEHLNICIRTSLSRCMSSTGCNCELEGDESEKRSCYIGNDLFIDNDLFTCIPNVPESNSNRALVC